MTAEEIVQNYQVKLIDYSTGQVVYIKNNCNLLVNALK
ncbi:hypothetical protein LLAPH_506_0035 [Lactococcus phage ASCC506]|uniref:Uncharacterized protein n=15 Tax=Skunavirus ASCC273 TaxID=1165135 RepID=H9EGP6_9CAUD|nr:hypothetical protein LLAPH_273_0035 [Lactococcus phage ASCC273]AFE87000.1 hypothetical protein LLAPH_287_0035 [Lactococcus phage ASCC287]AFE87113.1 hypothetical protein LLAPH_324_0035 [Lactococcus phage ASCC324]AFE87171.1 hypothetical protein LLAPH_337_0035 [Lactococcus phage ASCC337]AFE87397.1 hypothetical protein LLAPH_368_0035 [Lactococcus phage ASCC368]AFE87455.1 hypothetical protein LLAPH_395_0035 [Lactococcus phage ASCC395]AFE87513.1 hypothetical protein LLAPH_397_0035 [Lactococcus p